MKLYLDVESVGLKGPLLMVQYSFDRAPIRILEDVYKNNGMGKLKRFLNNPEVILTGFNVGFDVWKLYQFFKPDVPFACQVQDLWVHALKSKPLCYYPFVGGKDLVILRKIHKDYAPAIEKLVLKEMKKFVLIGDLVVKHKEEDEPFETLVFHVNLNSKLKTLATLFTDPSKILKFDDVLLLPKHVKIDSKTGEILGISQDGTGPGVQWKEDKKTPGITWGELKYYQYLTKKNLEILADPERRPRAIEYARKDIEYLWGLEDYICKHNNIKILPVTHDDTCTHIVAYTKYYGIPIDTEKAQKIKTKYEARKLEIETDININLQSFPQRKTLLIECLQKEFQDMPIEGTGVDKIKILISEGLVTADGKVKLEKLIEYKPLCQRIKQLETILAGNGRAYPDFAVHGTITGRMGGRGGLNWQGIPKDGEIREVVKFVWGLDFKALEMNIAAVFFKDKQLLAEIGAGIDPHTKTVSLLISPFRGRNYDELMEIKENPKHSEYKDFKAARAKAKSLNFATLYYAAETKQGEILGVSPEEAKELMTKYFYAHYLGLAESRKRYFESFCTADFETWDKGSVRKMAQYVENAYGDRRYTCFEAELAAYFWENTYKIASVVPKSDTRIVVRMKHTGKQEMMHSIRSALLGAASGIQKKIFRQVGNYPIQSTGARLTKELMCKIWKAHKVSMINIHDEINIIGHPNVDIKRIEKTVEDFISKSQSFIKYLAVDAKKMENWGG